MNNKLLAASIAALFLAGCGGGGSGGSVTPVPSDPGMTDPVVVVDPPAVVDALDELLPFAFIRQISRLEDFTGSPSSSNSVTTGTADSTVEFVTETTVTTTTTDFSDTVIVDLYRRDVQINVREDVPALIPVEENRTRYESKASTSNDDITTDQVINPAFVVLSIEGNLAGDLTILGTVDTKLGGEYLSDALLITVNYILSSTHTNMTDLLADLDPSGVLTEEILLSNVYNNFINVEGLSGVHADGWTGKGTDILVYDLDDTHAINIGLLSSAVAPGANTVVYNSVTNTILLGDNTVDYSVIVASNNSYGYHLNDINGHNYFDLPDTYKDDLKNGWLSSYNNALNRTGNAVIVFSAGNNGGNTESRCDIEGSRLTADSCTDIKFVYDNGSDVSRTIWVGSTDGTNDDVTDLASYSVSAGDTAKFDFIVADGTAFDGSNGTSFAAPRVTGAVALVAHKFPNTTAEDRKLIILNTADDLGVAGVDAVFGHGRLNVGAALAPIGNLH